MSNTRKGTPGDDDITVTGGYNRIEGGTGDDVIHGGAGEDTYIFNIGDGHDTIHDNVAKQHPSGWNSDVISFGKGISKDDLIFTLDGNDWLITFTNTSTDSIRIVNAMGNIYCRIDNFMFADGTTLSSSTILSQQRYTEHDDIINVPTSNLITSINAGGGNDTVTTGDSSAVIDGGAGNDTITTGSKGDQITGGQGDDIINAGGGNDVTIGGSGSDTYIFNIGDGHDIITEGACGNTCTDIDIIKIGAGVTSGDLIFRVDGDDLIIGINGHNDDSIRITGALTGPSHGIEKIVFADGTSIELTAVISYQAFTDANDIIQIPANVFIAIVNAGGGNDTITGGSATTIVNAGSGNDIVTTGSSNDILSGGSDNDTINAGGGNDTITGGTGDDILTGGTGGDTYIFNIGDGNDTIHEGGCNGSKDIDVINLGVGISVGDIIYSVDGNDLIIGIKGHDNDSIRISGGITDPSHGIEKICFANGTSIAVAAVISCQTFTDGNDTIIVPADKYVTIINAEGGDDTITGGDVVAVVNGGSGDDTITTGSGNDTLSGGADNDTINAGGGNDTITGGTGDDILTGGTGSDTYIFNIGDGNDTIHEGACDGSCKDIDIIKIGVGVTADDLIFSADGDDLIIGIKGHDGDSIRISGGLVDPSHGVEKIALADGTSIAVAAVVSCPISTDGNDTIVVPADKFIAVVNANGGDDTITGGDVIAVVNGGSGNDTITTGSKDDVLSGGSDNDTINAGGGNDTITGGTGDDILTGGTGGDTYIFNIGDGNDTIHEGACDGSCKGIDIIKIGVGVTADDLVFSADGDDLIIGIKDHDDDSIRISGGLVDPSHGVEKIVLADGKSIAVAAVVSCPILTDGNDTFVVPADKFLAVVDGKDGDDTITGGDVTAVVNGGSGNDTITTGSKDDVLFGGSENDIINAGGGNDTITGGTDDDILTGGTGGDTYIFNIGDGNDTIHEGACDGSCKDIDIIKIGVGVTADDLVFSADGDDLIIGIKGHDDDSIRISGGLVDPSHGVEKIVLADGTSIAVAAVVSCPISTDGDDTIVVPADKFIAVVNAKGGDDTITGGDVIAVVNGGSGNDTITTGSKDDVLSGGSDNDTINAGGGNDTITGGTGDDILTGGTGGDTYIFNIGDGNDTIHEGACDGSCKDVDIIKIGVGVTADDLIFSADGDDLIIGIKDHDDDSIRISGGLVDPSHGVEKIVLADGTSIAVAAVVSCQTLTDNDDTIVVPADKYLAVVNAKGGNDTITTGDTTATINGGSGNDTITTGAKADSLSGGEGDDTINAGGGNDTITGGIGNDTLTGGSGSDTYIFNIGDGHDTIVEASVDPAGKCLDTLKLGSGIAIEDLRYSSDGDDLIINFRGNETDSIRIVGAQSGKSAGIESICFADGTKLEISSALSIVELTKGIDFHVASPTGKTTIINGYDGMDTIMVMGADPVIVDGGAGDDRISLGTGGATVYGGAGHDMISATIAKTTFVGGTGNDTMLGSHRGDTYIFNKGDGIDMVQDNVTLSCVVNEEADTLKFGKGITKKDVSFFMQGQNLVVSYGESDQVTIAGQASAKNAIENIQLASGSSLSSAEINQIVADLSNYASEHGLDFTSVEDVKNSQELMSIVTAAWDN
ncbi:beta strand repeat-containing protein [Halodesulfovibrio marinisediminis]|uniref:Ca2+-binding protein, RTX toxin-related n=1 Tax=Halodesulfovibrio marinisediminis DSM 17456 TaxID=1121457 RepID=A0A1N6IG70_9BACT|nr:calcium-binding protein [Halodesulfovibrio marinisediminis]SIO30959.1 Ca2+-binding protein, RTX toxin-related [Halodesulfovibrio marinisediminis DSM 17456]